ncbi:hypothetical protein [Bdellovibrio sp.]|uniref:hypothetical protein n=1 Tax=Bdellovibrio sp. TaxID=28201 RepID=UPI0039E369BE
METLNNKTLSFPAKYFTRAFAALGIVLSLVACNKDGGGSGVTTAVYGNGCSNCGAISSPVLLTTFQMQSGSGNVVFSNMQMYGQSTGIVANASGNIYRNYQGPIAIQGQMTVTQAQQDWGSGCIIQPGTYTVQTYSVGQMGMAGGDVLVPVMIAGGIEMRIDGPLNTMAGGVLEQNGQRLYARVSIVKVNGYVCSSTFFGDFN